MVVLELLHLKMEVTVSEPCDVIRVHSSGLTTTFPQPTTGRIDVVLLVSPWLLRALEDDARPI